VFGGWEFGCACGGEGLNFLLQNLIDVHKHFLAGEDLSVSNLLPANRLVDYFAISAAILFASARSIFAECPCWARRYSSSPPLMRVSGLSLANA